MRTLLAIAAFPLLQQGRDLAQPSMNGLQRFQLLGASRRCPNR
jgi:hypothetical protein